jgi:hypothetical protein
MNKPELRKHNGVSRRMATLNPAKVAAEAMTVTRWLKDNNHGHVRPTDDGSKARCGGPIGCPVCQADKLISDLIVTNKKLAQELTTFKLRGALAY